MFGQNPYPPPQQNSSTRSENDFSGFEDIFENVPPMNNVPPRINTPPIQNIYHATVGQQRQNKVDKATAETNQYMAQNKIIEYLTITLGSKFLEIEQIINDDMYTETTIELLEDHGAWLDCQKVFVGKKAGIVANLISNLQPNSLVF